MPGQRSLRSNKGNSDANDEDKQEKPPTTRAAAAKAKSGSKTRGAKGGDDKADINGSKSTGNGVDGPEDVEMGDGSAGAPKSSFNASKDREGDQKMTVVVPPTKGSRSSGKDNEDVTMEGAEDEKAEDAESEVDPATKAIQGLSRVLARGDNR